MNKIIAICAAQIYLWEQERQIHAICDCARERGYEVMIYNLSVKMDVETSHSRGELSVFSVIPYDQLAALVVLGESIRNDVVSDDLVAKAHKNNVPVVISIVTQRDAIILNLTMRNHLNRSYVMLSNIMVVMK